MTKHLPFLEWFKQLMPYASTIILAVWGGIVHHIQNLRKGRNKFRLKELLFDIIISSFAGLLTFYFCEYSHIDETMSAILIAISGHMGTRAIAGFECIYNRLLGVEK